MRTIRLNGFVFQEPEPGDPGFVPHKDAPSEMLLERGRRLQVSDKGCVSVYGLRKFPISLYADEWEWVINNIDKIRAFIDMHPGLPRK